MHTLWFQMNALILILSILALTFFNPSGSEIKYPDKIRSLTWLRVPWFLASPGLQQPWHCLCKIIKLLYCTRGDFNYLGHFIVANCRYIFLCSLISIQQDKDYGSQWFGTLVFSLMLGWKSYSKNSREASDLRRLSSRVTSLLYICRKCQWTRNATTLRWRHNGRDSVSNHQPHDCL